MMTEAERLVSDIVNVTGELVDERRLAVAQTYLDTWRRRAEAAEATRDRQAKACLRAGWASRVFYNACTCKSSTTRKKATRTRKKATRTRKKATRTRKKGIGPKASKKR